MRRVIGGKIYDTKTAEEIHEASASCPTNDFQYWEESLYKTRRGAWFLAGSGGPMTHYAKSLDSNSWSGGEALRVLTPEEALEWLEEHDADVDMVQAHFADTIEEA